MLSEPIRFTLFCGNPNTKLRHHSWNLLHTLATTNNLTWCLFGDFNDILSLDESTSHNYRPSTAIQAFQQAISDCDLHDLGFSGQNFTYSNQRQESTEVKVHLDRFFGNTRWCSLFDNTKVRHLIAPTSDHCPFFLSTTPFKASIQKLFRFEDLWLRDNTFLNFVRSKWLALDADSGCLMDKLKLFKMILSIGTERSLEI